MLPLRTLLLPVVLTALSLLGACNDPGSVPVTEGLVPPPTTDYYVDAMNGDDNNPGTSTQPFRTITHALALTGMGDRVFVAPGRYDRELGEDLPLIVPAGVQLIGDEENKGGGRTPITAIVGHYVATSGTPTVLSLGWNAVVAGFLFLVADVPEVPRAKVTLDDGSTVRNCRFDRAKIVATGDHVLIKDNIVENNLAHTHHTAGIQLWGNDQRVEGNVVRNNPFGVYVWTSSNSDLGGGPLGSLGGNVITQNAKADLFVSFDAQGPVYAQGNTWDHPSPQIGTGAVFDEPCQPGTDICIDPAYPGTVHP